MVDVHVAYPGTSAYPVWADIRFIRVPGVLAAVDVAVWKRLHVGVPNIVVLGRRRDARAFTM
jgi:hypothetical protein